MYTLYYYPSACSLATQVILHELEQAVTIIDKQHVADFSAINPVGAVPVLIDGDQTLCEGAAVMIYLLSKHNSPLLPEDSTARSQAIQDIMFANATMHPAYNRLFFASANIENIKDQQHIFDAATQAINALWQVVEDRLQTQTFLGGEKISAADIMLTVYSRWGAAFPVNIHFGEKTTAMLEQVLNMPNFQRALQAEEQASAKV